MGESTANTIGKLDFGSPLASVHIYAAQVGADPAESTNCSILLCTVTGDVYLEGRNTLVRYYNFPSPVKSEKQDYCTNFVRVEELSGLGIVKIAVGVGFGVGLTTDGGLYLWGSGPRVVRNNSILMLKRDNCGHQCCVQSCFSRLTKKQVGSIDIHCCNGCYQVCNGCKVYTPGNLSAYVFALHSEAKLRCSRCWKPCSFLKKVTPKLNYCEPCDILQEVETGPQSILPQKLLSGIRDVDCGKGFFCALDDKNELQVMRWDSSQSVFYAAPISRMYGTISTFSCGDFNMAFVTELGSLFLYGDLDNERILEDPHNFDTIPFRKVSVPGKMLKMVCGSKTIACLLADNSVWLSHKGVTRVFRSIYLELTSESEILAKDLLCSVGNRFFFKGSSQSIFEGYVHEGGDIVFNFEDNDMMAALHFVVTSQAVESLVVVKDETAAHQQVNQPLDVEQEDERPDPEQEDPMEVEKDSSEEPCEDQLFHFRPIAGLMCQLKELFGQKLISDVTINLADGEFPAHRQLLYITSNYFRKFFTNNDDVSVLDMSSYNPKAYRALLRHFYQANPEELGLEDLMDLYTLATSYEESAIVKITTDQLKNHIGFTTVLKIITKARSSSNQELIDECESFISSPEYKEYLMKTVLQDPSVFTPKQ